MSQSIKPSLPDPAEPRSFSGSRGIACNLDVFTPAEREQHMAVGRRFKAVIVSAQELPNGQRLGIKADPGSLALLAEFVEGERRCCPFFEFTIRLEPGSAALWLDLTGPEGTREFIGEEFKGMR